MGCGSGCSTACGKLGVSTFLSDFKSVNTSAARYQNLSLNPAKITGACGRLKCCLNYELDTYLDALQHIPRVRELHTKQGTAYLQKTDIFRGMLWFSYGDDANWTALTIAQVNHIRQLNQQGIRPPHLLELQSPQHRPTPTAPDFVDVVGQSRLHEQLAADASARRKGRKRARGAQPKPGSRPT